MKKVSLLFVALLIVFSCSKDNPPKPEVETEQETEEEIEEENQDLEIPKIAENVVVISGDTSDLISSETDLENGLYIIQYTGDVSAVAVGDIVVGDEEDGFLRKVNTITVSGNTQTMETEQATFEDVFENADLSFNLDLANLEEVTNKGYPIVSQELLVDYVAKGVSMDKSQSFSFDLSATPISSGGLSFKVTGNATFNPNFNFDAEIRGFRIQTVVFEANNANLSLTAGYELSSSGSVSVNNEVSLARLRKRFTFLVGPVPVVVTADVRLNASLNTTLDATLTASGKYTKTYTVDTGVNFNDGQWTRNFSSGQSTSIDPLSFDAAVNLSEVLAITPNVQVKFYGVIAPYVEPEMFADYNMSLNSNLEDWDSDFGVGLNFTAGVKALIFGRTILDFAGTGTVRKALWSAPSSVQIVSGNEQEGDEEEVLEEPLRLKVLDNLGNPVKFVPVHFKLVKEDGSDSSSGSVDNDMVDTNDEGIAEFNWTLGKASDEDGTTRFAEISIKDSKAEVIPQDPPIRLEAEIRSKILTIISGNNQKEEAETALPEPLVVQVTNSDDEPLEDVEVFIELVADASGNGTSTSGSIGPSSVVTDAEGMAEFNWTLGKEDDEDGNKRFARVTIKDEDGNIIEQDEPVVFEADINPTTGCGSFVDLALFTTTQCGQVININDVLVSAEQTTAEDCSAGACSFGEGFNGSSSIGAFPARILFDIGNYQDLTATEILIKYTDGCGSGCSKAFVYDENNNLLASMENTVVSQEAEFKFTDATVLEQARFVAFSSCEASLNCFDMTFED